MKARLFIIASSICLTLWMTASFFHDTGAHAYRDADTGKVNQDNNESPHQVDPSQILTTSLRD